MILSAVRLHGLAHQHAEPLAGQCSTGRWLEAATPRNLCPGLITNPLFQVGDQSRFVTTCTGVLRGSQAAIRTCKVDDGLCSDLRSAVDTAHVSPSIRPTCVLVLQVGDQSEFVTTCAGVLRGSQAGMAGAASSLSQRLGEALQPTAFGYLCDKLAASFCPRCAQMLGEIRAKMFTGWDDVGLGCINHQVL